MQAVKSSMQQILWKQDKQVYLRKNKSFLCQLLVLNNITGRKRVGHWEEHPGERWCNPTVMVFTEFWGVFIL